MWKMLVGHDGGLLLLLCGTTLLLALNSILLQLARGEQDGFPFLFESTLFFPVLAQCLFYWAQLVRDTGSSSKALTSFRDSLSHAGPCLRYSALTTVGSLLDIRSMGHLDASTAAVLRQASLLCVLSFEALILGKLPSKGLVVLALAQCGAVTFFSLKSIATDEASAADVSAAGNYLFGVACCLSGVASLSFGDVLREKYIQQHAPAVPVAAKLFLEHLCTFALIAGQVAWSHGDVLRTKGVFHGWTLVTAACSLETWLMWAALSSIFVHASALAACMAIAASVAVTGVLEQLIFGNTLLASQWLILAAICGNTILYSRLKGQHDKSNLGATSKKDE